MQPAPDLDERVITADVGAAAPGDRVRLVIVTDGGSCTVAAGVVAPDGVRVSLLDAALVRWVALGTPLTTTTDEVEACDGLPPVDGIVVPAGGWAVGLRHAASTHDLGGSFTVVPIGADGRWWHVVPTADGVGSLTFDHADAPPTRFSVRVDQRVVARGADPVNVARGGAAIVELPGDVSYAALVPPGVAEITPVGTDLVVLGRSSGVAEGVMRVGDLNPEPLRVEVGAPVTASRGEIVVPASGKRRLLVDRAVVAWWVGAPEILDVVVKGRRLILSGLGPGRTHLVLRDDTGTLVTVPIVVGV